jgi:hypothetical protein
MAYQEHYTLPAALWERINNEGFDAMPELLHVIIKDGMLAERQQYLEIGPYSLASAIVQLPHEVTGKLDQRLTDD